MLPAAIVKVQQKASLQMAVFIGILFFLVQVALSAFAPAFTNHRMYSCFLLSLVGLVSGCAGWSAGIFLSPLGSQINGAQKVLAGLSVFWSGVIISRLQDVSAWFSARKTLVTTPTTKIELVFGMGIFLLALCVTFNTRFDESSAVPNLSSGEHSQ